MLEITSKIQGKGAHLECTDQNINTADAMARFFFSVIGAIAELERETIIQRTTAGLEAAKEQGRLGGRPKKFDEKTKVQAKVLIDAGVSKAEVCERFNFKRATLYRMLAS